MEIDFNCHIYQIQMNICVTEKLISTWFVLEPRSAQCVSSYKKLLDKQRNLHCNYTHGIKCNHPTRKTFAFFNVLYVGRRSNSTVQFQGYTAESIAGQIIAYKAFSKGRIIHSGHVVWKRITFISLKSHRWNNIYRHYRWKETFPLLSNGLNEESDLLLRCLQEDRLADWLTGCLCLKSFRPNDTSIHK